MQLSKPVLVLSICLLICTLASARTEKADTTSPLLPVRLESFELQLKNGNEVQLNWVSAEQWTNVHYEIERSDDGSHFFTVGYVYPIPGPDPQKDFSFSDYLTETELAQSQWYYRLRQVGENNPIAYSPTRILKLNAVEDEIESFYPNPCLSDFNLQVSTQESTDITVLFVDIHGNVALQKKITMRGSKVLSFPEVGNFKKGMYHVQVLFGNRKIISRRIMKL